MRIAICDDNPFYLEQASEIISDYYSGIGVSAEINAFRDGTALCDQDSFSPDILFQDIRMEGQDGIETAKRINEKWPGCYVIYLTDYLSYAVDVYQTDHVYYVLKSQLQQRLPEITQKIQQSVRRRENKLLFKDGNDDLVIEEKTVLYFERNLRITRVITTGGIFEIRENLDSLEKRLPEMEFARCHNSFLLHIPAIQKLGSDYVELMDGQRISISRKYQKHMKAKFSAWALSR